MQETNDWILHKLVGGQEIDYSKLLFALNNLNIEGVEESKNCLKLYYKDNTLTQTIKSLCVLLSLDLKHVISIEKPMNWNAVWESSFEPVTIDSFCVIYAHFHQINPNSFKYNIRITPQMSFGTGHHETTRLMILQMKKLNWHNKSVFDFGTGTGILAILAEMMGSTKIMGIDNMPWAVENAKENASANNCSHTEFLLADHAKLPGKVFDIVLVNIIRKVIQDNFDILEEQVASGGYLLLSGFLKNDAQKMIYEAQRRNFSLINQSTENKWVCQLYQKSV